MADTTQAVYLELAVRALENGDRPALAGALASLDLATLDHLAAIVSHPVWAAINDRYADVLNTLPLPRR